MSLFKELPPRPQRRGLSRSMTITLIILSIALVIIFGFTDITSDIAFIQHFVSPPQHFTYTGHSSYVSGLRWSPNGELIASSSGDGTVQIWQAATGKLARTYRGHQGDVTTVAWSPDGKYVALGSRGDH